MSSFIRRTTAMVDPSGSQTSWSNSSRVFGTTMPSLNPSEFVRSALQKPCSRHFNRPSGRSRDAASRTASGSSPQICRNSSPAKILRAYRVAGELGQAVDPVPVRDGHRPS